jgi:hypothetical protein
MTRGGFKAATTDEAQIERWWTETPNANIGAQPPPGYVVIDVDPRNGGLETWGTLEREYEIPPTLTAITGGSGAHLWFKTENAVASPGKGIDVKSSTGYVLVPPSVHASGQTYEWDGGFDFSSVADAPAWLPSTRARVERETDESMVLPIPKPVIEATAALLAPYWVDGRQSWTLPFFGYLLTCGWGEEDRVALVETLGGDKLEKYVDLARRVTSMDGPGKEAMAWANWDVIEHEIRRTLTAFTSETFADAIPELKPSPTPGFTSFASTRPRAVKFVIKELELGGDVRPGLITGSPNGGKTPLMLYLALCVVFGKPFLGFLPQRTGNVLFAFFEGSQNLILLRLLRMARGMGIKDHELQAAYESGAITLLYTNGGPVTGAQEIETLHRLCKEKQFALGVVDTLTSSLDGATDINTTQARGPLVVLSKLTELTGVPWLVTAHSPKSSGEDVFKTLGSITIAGAADTIHLIERGGDKTKFTFSCARAVTHASAPVCFQFTDSKDVDFELETSYALHLETISAEELAAAQMEATIEAEREKRALKQRLAEDRFREVEQSYTESVCALLNQRPGITHKEILASIGAPDLTNPMLGMIISKLEKTGRLKNEDEAEVDDYNLGVRV